MALLLTCWKFTKTCEISNMYATDFCKTSILISSILEISISVILKRNSWLQNHLIFDTTSLW